MLTIHSLQSLTFNHALAARLAADVSLIEPVIGDLVAPVQGNGRIDVSKMAYVSESNLERCKRNCQLGRLSVTGPLPGDSASFAKGIPGELEEEGLVGGEVHVTGDVIVLNNVLSELVVSQVTSTVISLLVSMLVLVLLTRRLGQSLVVILPVGLAGAWVVGAMAVLGMNWNVLTIMITALTIGLGIDYSIHVWRRFEANRLSGMGTCQAMRDMYATTGTALLLSAGTTICGFLVLKLSPIPVIQDFGIVSSISVLFSLMMALFVLPGLLAAEVRSGNGYD